MIDMFKMSSAGLPRGTRVVGFRGSEGISRLYAFEVYLAMTPDGADAFDLADAVGAGATLTADRQDGRSPFVFHGILSDVALVHHERDGLAIARAVLVPRLWQLTQTLHSRIFTKLPIPDILKQILDKTGQDYALRLSQQYPAEEHVCQYAESDLDFLSRWMEREGMYYFFEQGDGGEKLIITDSKSSHEDLAPAPIRFFVNAGGDVSARECLHSFVCRRRSLPASVSFKDHDYTKPKLDVSGKAPVSKRGTGEIHVHGARFFSADDGKRLARLRAEEILAREVVFTGSGSCFHLRPGYTFTLEDHPRASFDAGYLATEAEHYGNQGATSQELKRLTGLDVDEVYRVDVTAIASAVQFRAEGRTAWPRIYGTEHGVIDGPADSEYAQIDDHGRYAVRFAFDESDLEAGKASTRVRMMQPHGGGTEGWHFPLRKGTEVLFTFLGGDPDRPVIAGVVPNATKPSPVTSSNHTKNVIQTGGRNRLEIEDREGQQRITLSTPHQNSYIRMGAPNDDHHMIIKTDGLTLLDAGQDWDVTVGAKLTEDVKGPVTETYHTGQTTTIKRGRTETITSGGMGHWITGQMSQTVKGDRIQTVTGDFSHTVNGDVIEQLGSQTLKCGPVVQQCGPCQFYYANMLLTTDGPIIMQGPKMVVVVPQVTFNSSSFTVNAPEINLKTGSAIKTFSPYSVDSFGAKVTFGGVKFDGTGLKTEATSTALARVAFKLDSTGFKVEHTGFKARIGPEAQTAALSLKNVATSIVSCGFAKLG